MQLEMLCMQNVITRKSNENSNQKTEWLGLYLGKNQNAFGSRVEYYKKKVACTTGILLELGLINSKYNN